MKAKPSKEVEKLKKKVKELTIENDRFKRIYEISNTLRSERNIGKLSPQITIIIIQEKEGTPLCIEEL